MHQNSTNIVSSLLLKLELDGNLHDLINSLSRYPNSHSHIAHNDKIVIFSALEELSKRKANYKSVKLICQFGITQLFKDHDLESLDFSNLVDYIGSDINDSLVFISINRLPKYRLSTLFIATIFKSIEGYYFQPRIHSHITKPDTF